MKRILFISVLTIVAVTAVRKYAYEPMYVASASMEPTLYVGQRLILDKLVFRLRQPLRSEIIIFRSVTGETHESGKRVIAIGGDTVEIKSKQIYLNGEKLYEPYADYRRPNEVLEGDNLGPLKVPDGMLFVLGDNRDNSFDSSMWKDEKGERIYFLPLGSVVGKVRGFY